jgi:hypothetical protein
MKKSPDMIARSLVVWTCRILGCTALVGLVFFGMPATALGQARPEPGTVRVPAQSEDITDQAEPAGEIDDEEADDQPKGKLRIWVAGGSPQMRLALGLAKPGQSPPEQGDEDIGDFIWVHRGMRPGDLYAHVNVPAGSYEPMIFEETIAKFTPENMQPKPPQWKSVVRRTNQAIRVTDGSCQTLILDLKGEKAALSMQNDKVSANSLPTVRLINLTDVQGVRVLVREANGQEKSLADDLTGSMKELTMPSASSTATFTVELPSPGTKMKARLTREADFRSSSLFYLVIAKDRYDRLQARAETGCR